MKSQQDVVSEGDGSRIIRRWKFILPYLKADGSSSKKYALEGFNFLCQVNGLLPKKDADLLIWNRSVKNKNGPGSNIPLDLALEHYIRIMKLVMRKLGGNATNKAILDGYSKALVTTKQLMDNYGQMSWIIKRSGKHVTKTTTVDLDKIVDQLVSLNAFSDTENRKYKHFCDIKSSIISDFDSSALFKWINNHKKKIHLSKLCV